MLSGATVALAGFRSCVGCSRFRLSLYLLLAACNLNKYHGEAQKVEYIVQKSGQSQSKGQLIDSCNEVNQSNSSILEENAQFGDDQLQSEQQMQEESHTESYTSFDSTSKNSSKVYNSVECNWELGKETPMCSYQLSYLKDMPESYITNILELIQLLFPGESGVDQLVKIIKVSW